MSTISLLIVEDHDVYSNALLHLLSAENDFHIAGIVHSAEEALASLPQDGIDLVLVDISLPGMNGISLVEQIQAQKPSLPCVMISGYFSTKYLQDSLKVGAKGYLLKDNYQSIIEGIWSVVNGATYISKEFGDLGFDLSQT